ncbi:MAG: hypothetical protein COW63_18770 [Bacteroidetes bacterium CG18_big_fil_WC_8_21_14_2_50_41_14]|nr:MAG: hypothetical protein COW63_18770 [Bacteroidetes bacterium CG18_big_fil_WC_8_21_14_2_50_41_14]
MQRTVILFNVFHIQKYNLLRPWAKATWQWMGDYPEFDLPGGKKPYESGGSQIGFLSYYIYIPDSHTLLSPCLLLRQVNHTISLQPTSTLFCEFCFLPTYNPKFTKTISGLFEDMNGIEVGGGNFEENLLW